MGVVRPEFRADTLTFSTTDPIFGGGACGVESCTRPARGHGLCAGHHLRWRNEGCKDLAVFVSTTDPRWERQRPNASCRITACGYGMCRSGLCQLHFQRWERAGRPDLEGWLSDPPAVKQPTPGACCAIAHCELWPQAQKPLCHAHAARRRVLLRGLPAGHP
jgi:hypothetical protein